MLSVFQFLQNNFALFTLIGGILTFVFPDFFLWGESLPDILLMISLFLGFLKLDFISFRNISSNIKRIFMLSVVSMVILPIVFYYISLPLSVDLQIATLLLMGASSAVATPLLASFWNLDIFRTFLFVSITSLIIPITVPTLVFFFFGITLDISFIEMSLFLGKMLFFPLVLALVCKYFFREFTSLILPYTGGTGTLIFFFLITFVLAPNVSFITKKLIEEPLFFIGATVWISLLYCFRFLLAYYVSAKNKKEKWSNLLMIGLNNNYLIVILAAEFFSPIILFLVLLSEIPWFLALSIYERFLKKYYNMSSV